MSFQSMHTAVTGLLAHGERMNVIGNNLANVSTIGFKKTDALFCDLVSEYLAGTVNQMPSDAVTIGQKGLGVAVETIRTSFIQGGFELGQESTDLAIGGRGFFGVRDPEAGTYYYTRAGNFRFDVDGYLLNPHSLRLQGYEFDQDSGRIVDQVEDIQLPYVDEEINGETIRVVKSPPRATTSATLYTNLDYSAVSQFSDADNPFFAMALAWNGLDDPPLGGVSPNYTTSISIYDADGEAHTLTVYYDRVEDNALSNAGGGYSYWEFCAAIDPSEDGRSETVGTSAAGLLAMGTLTFNHDGMLVGESFYTLNSGAAGGVKELGSWVLADFDSEGFPLMDITFVGSGGAALDVQQVALDFGLGSSNAAWDAAGLSASNVGIDAARLANMDGREMNVYATTGYDTGSATLMAYQDGYASGYLTSLGVDSDGFLIGYFSNSESMKLYQVALYRFNSEDGLRREGNNLFAATEASGEAQDGVPGQGGRGEISEKTLESSNVDMAREFADLILTQRGFQCNTKVVTTADSLLNTVMQIKR
ncbi:MAG: flagellar hook protein FlgE [Desulfovibrionaceae bacterium]|nr:flagellar hook protein FlgE [Desulfovibrionaceae bacterium]